MQLLTNGSTPEIRWDNVQVVDYIKVTADNAADILDILK